MPQEQNPIEGIVFQNHSTTTHQFCQKVNEDGIKVLKKKKE
jgi:hypothetical protein